MALFPKKYPPSAGIADFTRFVPGRMVLELHSGYVKVSWGLKECIPNLRSYF